MRRGGRTLGWLMTGLALLLMAGTAGADVKAKASAVARNVATTTVCGPTSLGGGITGLAPAAGGGGYAVGDVLSILGGPGNSATCRVQSVVGGVVTVVGVVSSGSQYAIGGGAHATSALSGVGAGCTVTVTGVSIPDAAGKIASGAAAGNWPVIADVGPAWALGEPLFVANHDQDATFQHRAYANALISGPPGGNKIQITALAIGEGSSAGGLHGSVYLPPDTAFAGVGLYGPGPTDSMLIAIVDRTTSPTNLGITFSANSALQVRSLGNSHEQPRATFKMLIYDSDADANADPNQTGVGAKFSGTVILDGSSGTLQTRGGFAASDWFLVNNGAGKYTARSSPTNIKSVPVSNSLNAAVVLVGDPAIVQATPGQSPIILILLALALAGTGVWAIRKRSGQQLA